VWWAEISATILVTCVRMSRVRAKQRYDASAIRSFELRASLSLAQLTTAGPLDAHAILAPILAGFSPTSEMPEIAAAQALLATLEGKGGQKPRLFGRHRRD
jgi:hypothetical protein